MDNQNRAPHPGPPKKKLLVLPDSNGYHLLTISEIIRCRADGNYTILHRQDEPELLVCRQLGKLEPLLTPHGFLRVHHSHLVNLQTVKRFVKRKKDGRLLLANGDVVPVARSRKAALLAWMGVG